MKLLNLGCGNRYHTDWVNVDFVSADQHVIAHNLLKGIPFENQYFDVVYHSHVLEHFTRSDGEKFIAECYRVLKPGGILRIAVPDLERIASEYLKQLQGAMAGDPQAAQNYQWMMIELYDQTTRNQPQGEAGKYLSAEVLPNEQYVYDRVGLEAKGLRDRFLQKRSQPPSSPTLRQQVRSMLSPRRWKERFYKLLLGRGFEFYKIGRFRLGGEIHQYMYDRYSLSVLLRQQGFKTVKVQDAFQSLIPGWDNYQLLDVEKGQVRKPDSLFIEAVK